MAWYLKHKGQVHCSWGAVPRAQLPSRNACNLAMRSSFLKRDDEAKSEPLDPHDPHALPKSLRRLFATFFSRMCGYDSMVCKTILKESSGVKVVVLTSPFDLWFTMVPFLPASSAPTATTNSCRYTLSNFTLFPGFETSPGRSLRDFTFSTRWLRWISLLWLTVLVEQPIWKTQSNVSHGERTGSSIKMYQVDPLLEPQRFWKSTWQHIPSWNLPPSTTCKRQQPEHPNPRIWQLLPPPGRWDHVGHNFSPKNHTLLPGWCFFGVKNRTSGFNPSSVKFLENWQNWGDVDITVSY